MTPEQAEALAEAIQTAAINARAHSIATKQRRIDDLQREILRLTAEKKMLEVGDQP